jgi:hypothetical protein
MSENKQLQTVVDGLPLRSPEDVDLSVFNSYKGPDDKGSVAVKDIKQLFHKLIVVDEETLINAETLKIPGFIGISDDEQVADPQDNTVYGYEDIIKFLDKYGLLICTYQYNKDRYGKIIDLRLPPNVEEQADLMDIFIKNEGHHSGAIVPAQRFGGIKAFASLNEPDNYHDGMYGNNGFVAVAQRLVFPEFVTQQQARGYTDSIICWLALINPFANFALNDINGGDPARVCDRATLKKFLKNCALASLGVQEAIEFLNQPENTLYCSEFIYIGLNTPVYPFNLQGLTMVLDGDEAKAKEILKLQEYQNIRRENILSVKSSNPQFKAFNIQMPVLPENLPPLDVLMANGEIEANSIPFPPFKLSQVLRRAFRTLFPRQEAVNDIKRVKAQAKMLEYLEPLILKQLNLDNSAVPGFPTPVHNQFPMPRISPPLHEISTPSNPTAPDSSKVIAVRQFIVFVQEQLQRQFDSYEEFDVTVDLIMEKADELVGAGDFTHFVPPRIYIDLGQNDGDNNLPKGWGFRLETVGALIYRGAIMENSSTQPISEEPSVDGSFRGVDQPSNEGEDGSREQPSGFVDRNRICKGNITTVNKKGNSASF